jgi:large subunit ribosomal protein L21
MYAVIEAGGKQYRVELGSEIEIDRLDVTPGSSIELGRVLLVADGDDAQIGTPVVDGARVTADVLRQDRGEKIDVFKYRPKARRRVKKGHRAELTVVRVSDIVLNGKSAAQSAQAETKRADAERAAAEKEASRKAAADQALAEKLAAEQAAEATAADESTPATRSTTKSASAKAATAKPVAKKPATSATGASKPSAKSDSTTKKTSSAAKSASRTKKDE